MISLRKMRHCHGKCEKHKWEIFSLVSSFVQMQRGNVAQSIRAILNSFITITISLWREFFFLFGACFMLLPRNQVGYRTHSAHFCLWVENIWNFLLFHFIAAHCEFRFPRFTYSHCRPCTVSRKWVEVRERDVEREKERNSKKSPCCCRCKERA